MKTYLSTPIALFLFCLPVFAANPAFQDFYGTNGIIIRTNGNKVQVDGSALASTNGAVVLTNLIHTNVTWVAKNGDNTTGTPGNFARPYLSISNAVQASPAGTLVVVEPGLYNESVRLKNMVNIYGRGVIVSQSVNGLAVFFDNGSTVTNIITGDFTIIHMGNNDGLFMSGTDSDITLDRATYHIDDDSSSAVEIGRGNFRGKGTVFSNGHGIQAERISGTGFVSFEGSIFSTNNAAFITGGSAGSNYLRGYFASELYHAIQHQLGYILLEGSEVYAPANNRRAVDLPGSGDMEIKNTKLTSTDEAIGKFGVGGFLILDDLQLTAGATATYSIDNNGNDTHGTIEMRNPIWANLPIRPDMNVASNGFTRLSRYLSITTNDYVFPATQGAFDTFLKNDGSGNLNWSSNLSLLVVTNLNVINTTVLSNVTVKGQLIVTNIVLGGTVITNLVSGTTNFINLSVQAAKLPATNYPYIDAGWQAWETVYAETNAEGNRVTLDASWQFMVPPDYATNSLKLLINYSLLNTNGPNASNVVWGASVLSVRSGTTNNVHTNLFGSVVKGSNSWIAKFDGTNIVTNLVINLDTSSLLAPRDLSVIKLQRFVTEDTFGGAVSLHGLQLEYTRP